MIVAYNATSEILLLRLVDSSGDPITGVSESGVTIESLAYGDDDWQDVTLVAGTAGTYVSAGWVEIGAGVYQFCPPNALIVAGRTTQIRATVGANPVQHGTISATGVANVSNAGWDETELSQIRHRLGIDGTKEAPSESSPQLTVTVASTSVISVETPNADDAGRFTITQRDDYENDTDIAPIGPIRISTTQGLLRETNPPTLRFGATQLLGRKYGSVHIIGDAYAEAVAGEPNQYDLYIEIGRDELDKVPGDYGWDIEAVYNDNDVSTLVRGTMTLKQSMGDHEDRVA